MWAAQPLPQHWGCLQLLFWPYDAFKRVLNGLTWHYALAFCNDVPLQPFTREQKLYSTAIVFTLCRIITQMTYFLEIYQLTPDCLPLQSVQQVISNLLIDLPHWAAVWREPWHPGPLPPAQPGEGGGSLGGVAGRAPGPLPTGRHHRSILSYQTWWHRLFSWKCDVAYVN